jgi:glycosyltransferase involved in cell wall biosynthesis
MKSISIVIPVYNEADYLAECLLSIANQTVEPKEVIVVDNNSTDATADVARSFPFVKLLSEPKQGVVHARNLGFNKASSEIIARIDADTILPNDWLETLESSFSDDSIDAISGSALYYHVAGADFFNSIDLFFRKWLSKRLKTNNYLWGANMAITRSAWLKVRGKLCNSGGQHEDFDLAIHLQEVGGKVGFNQDLSASVSSRRIDSSYFEYLAYVWRSPQTYAKHHLWRRVYMYPVVIVCALGYLPALVMHRGYDPVLNRFTLYSLFTQKNLARVDPTANVIN